MTLSRLIACSLTLALMAPCAAVGQSADNSLVKKTLVIGIDGCRPDALLTAQAPHLKELIKSGAFSDKAQASEYTVSGPGWSSILTGVWWQKHGVRDNSFRGASFGKFPTFLTRYKAARPSGYTASIAQWSGITQIVKDADYASNPQTGEETAAQTCRILAEKDPDVVFIHFDDVDGAGHHFGFSPKQPQYLAAITQVDSLIGKILTAVRARKTFDREDWLIIVTTDHGGSGKGHGPNTPECRTIFFIVNGKAATAGTITPPPTQVDVAPTVLSHMGIAINPAWKLDGTPVGLRQPAGEAALARPARKKVLILGIDGCRPDAIPAAKEAYNLHALVAQGAFCDHCDILGDRPTKAFTITGPGWSTILTGAWSDKHGVMDNDFHNNHLAQFPSLFHRLKIARPEATVAAFVTWKPFVDYIIAPADGAELVFDGDKGGYEEGDRRITTTAVRYLKEKDPDLVFVYFGTVDITGHGYGFHPKSPKYTKAIEVVDEQIGRILAAVRQRPTYTSEDWLTIVCTDHGGKGREHGFGRDVPDIRNGLLILHGPSVDRSRLPAKTSNADVTVTALTHLGVRIQPEWQLDGRAVGLRELP